MSIQALFGVSILLSFVAFGLVTHGPIFLLLVRASQPSARGR